MAILRKGVAWNRSFPMVQTADHVTGLTGATVTVTLSKNGGAFAAPGGSVTEIGNGWYYVALNTTDTGTAGDLAIHCTATSGDPTDLCDQVWDQTVSTIGVNVVGVNAVAASSVTTINAVLGTTSANTPQTGDAYAYLGTNLGALGANATGITGVKLNATQTGVTIPTVTTVTNQLTAAAIATGVWQDTTSGDFTTSASIGKSVVNGVALGTGLTINGYTGNTPQTGDAYARLGAPAGASTSADIAALKTDLDAGVNVVEMNGNATAAANVAHTMQAICRSTVGSGSTTTSIVTSAFAPAGVASGQFDGRMVLFDANTTTTSLQGQATVITGSTGASTPTLTVTALTTAPVSGDTFSVV